MHKPTRALASAPKGRFTNKPQASHLFLKLASIMPLLTSPITQQPRRIGPSHTACADDIIQLFQPGRPHGSIPSRGISGASLLSPQRAATPTSHASSQVTFTAGGCWQFCRGLSHIDLHSGVGRDLVSQPFAAMGHHYT